MNDLTYRNVTEALPQLAAHVMAGDEVGSRLGERTMERLFSHVTLTHPLEREILNPLRKASLAAQLAESAWVLAGRDDIEWLSHYLPRAADFSDDGKVWRGAYGPRLRRWKSITENEKGQIDGHSNDQLQHVVDLLTADPGSRRAVMAIYNPARDSEPGKDIPCNDFIQFLSRLGELHMHVYIRSNDLIWGWSGVNQFEWSVLQEVVAGLLGIEVGRLSFTMGSLHVYDRHWAKAAKMIERDREESEVSDLTIDPEDSPRFDASLGGIGGDDRIDVGALDALLHDWFMLEEQIRTSVGALKSSTVAEVNAFPEPMLRSWLQVLTWHWHGDEVYLESLRGTRLHAAAMLSPKNTVTPESTIQERAETLQNLNTMSATPAPSEFIQYVVNLHTEKDAAYGTSWKRRGEMLGIMANLARKVDRLEGGETADETAADTAVDLLVYLAKYDSWLHDQTNGTAFSDTAELANMTLVEVDRLKQQVDGPVTSNAELAQHLTQGFEHLEFLVTNRFGEGRRAHVGVMMRTAYELAHHLWTTQPGYQGADVD